MPMLLRSLARYCSHTPLVAQQIRRTHVRALSSWSSRLGGAYRTQTGELPHDGSALRTGERSSSTEFDPDADEFVAKEVSVHDRAQAVSDPDSSATLRRQESDYDSSDPSLHPGCWATRAAESGEVGPEMAAIEAAARQRKSQGDMMAEKDELVAPPFLAEYQAQAREPEPDTEESKSHTAH